MSEWYGRTALPVQRTSYAFRVDLGKMLQAVQTSSEQKEVPYLSAVSVQADGLVVDPQKKMWASTREIDSFEVLAGDLLVVEGGDVGRSAFAPTSQGMIFQNSLHRVRPRDGNDIRYFRYVLEAVRMSGYLDEMTNKATIRHLTREKLASLRVPLPNPSEQVRIADFLDTQTAMIDALIGLNERMAKLTREREAQSFELALRSYGVELPSRLGDIPARALPSGWRVMRLSQTLDQLTNGYVGPTRDILVDEGVRYVQSLHIKNGLIDFDRRPFYVTQDWHDQRPRIHLRANDVLLVQTGDIGQVAVVPEDFGPASCHALQILRVRTEALSGPYLGKFLRSAFGRESLLKMATGALHPHLEGSIRSVPILVPPLDVQADLVDRSSQISAELRPIEVLSRRRVELLAERRRATISMSVTGELVSAMTPGGA